MAADGDGGKRILVTLRSDGRSKHGGDISLLQGFGSELAAHHQVETFVGVPSVEQLRSFDVVLGANLDRPVEPAETLARCRAAGTDFVFYSLHHPYRGVAAYLRNGVHGPRRALAAAARYSPPRYEQLLWLAHSVLGVIKHRRRPILTSVRRSQQRLIADSTRFVVCSAEEAKTVEDEVGPPPGFEIVPHPVDFPGGRRNPVPNRVIVPGRIESRKNQLMAVRLAKRFPRTEFVFVGAFLESDRRYVERFKSEVALAPNCRHIEQLPKAEFYPLLLTAAVVFSASWFEVTSLIELFCARNGIPLVVSDYSYLAGDVGIHRFRPEDPAQAEQALRQGLSTSDPVAGSDAVHSARSMTEVIGDLG